MRYIAMLTSLLLLVPVSRGQQSKPAPTCDEKGPASLNALSMMATLQLDPQAYKSTGLCRLKEDELKIIVESPGMVAKMNGEVMYVGFQRKRGDDYSKVHVFMDSSSDSQATTDKFIERVAANPFAKVVYSRDDADIVFHVYATQNEPQTIYLIAVNEGIPAKWQGARDEPLELAVGNPSVGLGRDPAAAADDVYDAAVFRAIERQHVILTEWEKSGSTGIILAK